MDLKVLTDEKILKYRDFIYKNSNKMCDYSLQVMSSYKEYFDFKYFYNPKIRTFFLFGMYDNSKMSSYLPFVTKEEDREEALKIINDYFLKNYDYNLTFSCVDEEQVNYLKKIYPNNSSYNKRMWADYIYKAKDLRDLSGKKYQSKRHQRKAFIRDNPNVIFRKIEKDELTLEFKNELKTFINKFENNKALSEIGKLEEEKAIELIDKIDYFNLDLFCLFIEDKVIGISICELVKDIIVENIEKCDRWNYKGIYPFITSKVCEYYINLTNNENLYLNREDDSGDEGLRYSKMELNPIYLLYKNVFVVENRLNLIDELPDLLIDDNIRIKSISRETISEYKSLVDDKDLNKLYYPLDEPWIEMKENELFDYINEEKEKKSSYNLGIYWKDNLIGDICIWNFKNDNSCELGIRLKDDYQGRGIAINSLNKTINYLNDIRLSKIAMRCFKENKKSEKLILKAGFTLSRSDETYNWFELNLDSLRNSNC